MLRFWICLLVLVWCAGAAVAQFEDVDTTNPVTTLEECRKMLRDAIGPVREAIGIEVKDPVEVHLIGAMEMDAITGHRGDEAVPGCYRARKGGKHDIYFLRGVNHNLAMGIAAHEFGHAWERENCNWGRGAKLLREGFAQWVEYHYFIYIGMNDQAEDCFRCKDPVYNEGLQLMVDLEQKVGVKGVVDRVRKSHTQDDLVLDR